MRIAHLKNQLAIKAWIVAMLALGFVVSVTIPKLAIMRLGELNYGVYALVVGFSGVLAFADLGLIPALTRGLAKPLAANDWGWVAAVLTKIDLLVLSVLACLASAAAGLMYWSMPSFSWNAFHALLIFVIATLYTIKADIRTALLRVEGAVIASYVLRGLFLTVYLVSVTTLYLFVEHWSGIWLICYAQLLASVVYYASVTQYLNRKVFGTPSRVTESNPIGKSHAFWAEAWRLSSPERLTRGLQMVSGAIERPLLLATAGLAVVASYDLLMRLMMFVSAVPGALSQPLLAMLAHDAVREPAERKFPLALRLTKIVSAICALVGLAVAIILFRYFHEVLFRIPSRIPLGVALLIAIVAAVNVQTASGAASLLADGRVKPINAKLYVEAAGIMIGVVAAWWIHQGMVFIIVRNGALGLSAIGFLIAENWTRRAQRSAND